MWGNEKTLRETCIIKASLDSKTRKRDKGSLYGEIEQHYQNVYFECFSFY